MVRIKRLPTIDYENVDPIPKTDLDITNPSTILQNKDVQAAIGSTGAAATAIGVNSAVFAAGVPERLVAGTIAAGRETLTAGQQLIGSRTGSAIATNTVRTALSVGSVATRTALTLGSVFAGPLVHLGLSTFIDGVVSWTKYRQPIMFFPLYREGEAWYAAMNGFKDNTVLQHFESSFSKVKNKFEFYNAYIDRVMNETFRK